MDFNKNKYERFRYTQETLKRALRSIANGELTTLACKNKYHTFKIAIIWIQDKLSKQKGLEKKFNFVHLNFIVGNLLLRHGGVLYRHFNTSMYR